MLLEAIHSDVTEVGLASISAYVEDLQSILLGPAAPGAEVTRLEHQMDLVVSYIPDEYDLLNALKPVNVVKCRARPGPSRARARNLGAETRRRRK